MMVVDDLFDCPAQVVEVKHQQTSDDFSNFLGETYMQKWEIFLHWLQFLAGPQVVKPI